MMRNLGLIAVFVTFVPLGANGSPPTPMDIIQSSKGGDRFKTVPRAQWTQDLVTPDTPTGCPQGSLCFGATSTAKQSMDGLGGTFNRACSYVLGNLSSAKQDDLIRDLFHPTEGAHFTIGKVPIAANDFSVYHWYSYEGSPTSGFNMSHDLEGPGSTVPFIKRAQVMARTGLGPTYDSKILLQATMDYPPAWMLNTSTPLPDWALNISGAALNTSLYAELAQYYLSFTQAMYAQDVGVAYLSLFNEPVESYCNVSNDEIHDLLTNHVGPLFRRTPGTPQLTWGEQYGRAITLEKYAALMNMSQMNQYVDILFYHGYDCEPWVCLGPDHLNTTCPGLDKAMQDIATYKEMYPDIPMWMTEACYAVEFDNYPHDTAKCPKLPRDDFEDGLQWGRMIYGDFAAGSSGWIYWNLILDQDGGPWLVSPKHNDPEDNYQQPVVIVDTKNNSYALTGVYYFMAHFSRAITRGMRYLEVQRGDGSPEDVSVNTYLAAFLDMNTGNYSVVAMNDKTVSANISIVFQQEGEQFSTSILVPPVSIITATFNHPLPEKKNDGGGPTDFSAFDWFSGSIVVIGVVVMAVGLVVGAGVGIFCHLRGKTERRSSAARGEYATYDAAETTDLYESGH